MTRIRFEDLPSTNTPRNAENLNKLNNVVISPTEPTTGEEVWIQKGKNLFNKDVLNIPYTYDTKISILDTGIRATAEKGVGNNRYAAIKLDKNLLGKTINLSATIKASSTNKPTLQLFFGTDTKPFLQNANIGMGETGTVKGTLPNQFPDGCNGLYLLAYVNTSGTYQIGDYVDYTNLQISFEEGSYEPYTDKKIYTKNDNGVYEEFLKVYDLTPKSIPIVLADFVKSGAVEVIRSGNVVVVEVSDVVFKEDRVEWNTVFAYGLPKPFATKSDVWKKGCLLNNKGVIGINGDGNLIISERTGTQSTSSTYNGQFIYMTTD